MDAIASLERIRRITDEIEDHRAAMHDLAMQRRQEILTLLRPDLGYGGLAKLLGVSRARVQQMANEARHVACAR